MNSQIHVKTDITSWAWSCTSNILYIGHSDTYLHKLFFPDFFDKNFLHFIKKNRYLQRYNKQGFTMSRGSKLPEKLGIFSSSIDSPIANRWLAVPVKSFTAESSALYWINKLLSLPPVLIYTHGNNTEQLQTSIHNNLFTLMKMDFWINDRPQIYDYK